MDETKSMLNLQELFNNNDNKHYFTNTLIFYYIDDCDKIIKEIQNKFNENITHFDVLRLNIHKVITQLKNYFNDVEINIYINSCCMNESKIKKELYLHKYDIYIIIKKNNLLFEIGYDLFENENLILENTYSDSKIMLDHYDYFIKTDIATNKDVKYYLNKILYKLMIIISSIKNDEYLLSEIIFVEANRENNNETNIMKQISYFTKIANWKKSNTINLNDLYNEMMFTDIKTYETVKYTKFKKTISEICEKNGINYNTKDDIINFDIFQLMILNIDFYYESLSISQYKLVYTKAMNMLMESLKIINELTKEINIKKNFTPDYINNLIMYHMNEFHDDNVMNNIYFDKINTKKKSFEKILDNIDEYCDTNKHNENNENKLNKIKQDLNKLYDDVFEIKK